MPNASLMAQPRDDHGFVIAGGRRRHDPVDQPHRRLAQHAGRLAALVAIDHPADRRRGVGADARFLQARAVERIHMAARASQDDGASRFSAVEVGASRRSPLVQRGFVVAAAEQPRATGQARAERLHAASPARRCSPPAAGRASTSAGDRSSRCARVRRSCRARAFARPDRSSSSPRRRRQHVRGGADVRDTAVPNADGLGDRGIDLRQNVAVVEHEVEHRRLHAFAVAGRGAFTAIARPRASRASRSMSSGVVSGGSSRTQLLNRPARMTTTPLATAWRTIVSVSSRRGRLLRGPILHELRQHHRTEAADVADHGKIRSASRASPRA